MNNAITNSTPAARWHDNNEPDPHGDRYDCERAALSGGFMTDDEMANAVFMTPNIANLTSAKDRIRWLSRQLLALRAELAESNLQSSNPDMVLVPRTWLLDAHCIDSLCDDGTVKDYRFGHL